jgi:16S rRNA (uracil1498-N3)-methyltransferase
MRIFVPPDDLEKKSLIRLSKDKSHYLLNVLRKKTGDPISVIDGKGKCYEAIISNINKKDVFIDLIRETPLENESPLNLVLCQSILKGEKMDIVVQKATELGIKEIIPLYTERCLVKKTSKTNRWKKISEESCEQCGRAFIPEIREPLKLDIFLKSFKKDKINGLIFWEEGGISLIDALNRFQGQIFERPVYIIIGPEGGLTAQEVKEAEDYGFIKTTLGRRILRAETAAIVVIALIQFIAEETTSILKG